MADNEDIRQNIELKYTTNADKTAKKVDNLDDSIEKTTDSQKEQEKQTKKNKQSLEDLGGGIGSTIKGFKGLLKQMWLLVANPIGLVIAAIAVALTTLFKAFTSTKAGAEKFDQIMAGISATIDVIRDRVLKFAGAIVKFFKGDFKGAIAEGRAAFSGFGAEVAEEFRIAAEATRKLQEVEDAMRSLSVTRAELDRDLAESERVLMDINATYEEKKKALKEVEEAERKQTEAELANARKKLEAIRAQNALSDSSAEALDAEAEAQIAVIELERLSAENRRKVSEFNKTLNNEEKARIKELTDKRRAAAKEREDIAKKEAEAIAAIQKKQLDTEEAIRRAIQDVEDKTEEERLERRKQREIERLEALAQEGVDTREALILNEQLYNDLEDELREKRAEEKAEKDKKEKEEQLKREKEQADKLAAIEKAKLEQQKAIEEAKFGLLNSAINLGKNIFAKNKKLQKGILIAENAAALSKITMNTVEAVSKDNAASPLTLGMPWSGIHIAQGALGAANVIASTAKGLKELGGGSAGSAPNVNVGRGGGSGAPQVGFQASNENQIGSTLATNINEQPPLRALVVESDMTDTQAAAALAREENSFG